MKQIGRKIFFDTLGNVIVDTGEKQGGVFETTVEQDIAAYTTLSERNGDTFDVLELPFGSYQQDFAESIGYSVNMETKTLVFMYPDPNAPEVEQPYQAPLSEEVSTLKSQLKNTQDAVDFLIMNSMPI